jgi:hypothetical protein
VVLTGFLILDYSKNNSISNSREYSVTHKKIICIHIIHTIPYQCTQTAQAFHKTFYFIIIHILRSIFYFETLKYSCKVKQFIPAINFAVVYYSVLGIIFINFTIISYTLQFKLITNLIQQISVYYPDAYLQLNMFWAFSRPSSGAR